MKQVIPYYNMKKEGRNRNWIAWIALGLSVIAIVLSLYSMHNSNSVSLQKTLEICISVMGIGITAILGIQIYTILTIDKRVQEKIEDERKLYKDSNSQLKEDLRSLTRTMQRFTTGNIYIVNEEYNEAFVYFALQQLMLIN